jgi:hypothetical protein
MNPVANLIELWGAAICAGVDMIVTLEREG